MRLMLRLVLILLASLTGAGTLRAQPDPVSTAGTANQAPALPGANVSPVDPAKSPALPGSKSPVQTFRELLKMSSGERAEALADRTAQQRGYLEAKLREYDSLPLEERESRLKQLELTYHLQILMRQAPAKRVQHLQGVPKELRPIIDERLKEWNLLPRTIQDEVLTHDVTANYFLRIAPPGSTPAVHDPEPSQPPRPGEPSESLAARFSRFYQLPPEQRQRTLDALPPAEREEIEKTLQQFTTLSPEQRAACIRSFDRLSRMTPAERAQFLKNAERWKAMSPRERETWRDLLKIIPTKGSALGGAGPVDSAPGNSLAASNTPALPGAALP
jgi:hypothetical protein